MEKTEMMELAQIVAQAVVAAQADMMASEVSLEHPTATTAAIPGEDYYYTAEPEAIPDRNVMMREALALIRKGAHRMNEANAMTLEDHRQATGTLSLGQQGLKDVMESLSGALPKESK